MLLSIRIPSIKRAANLLSFPSTFRSLSSSSLNPSLVTLYAYKICPFCCKTKSILKFAKVPFKAVEVNPLTKSELKAMEKSLLPMEGKSEDGKKEEVYRKGKFLI